MKHAGLPPLDAIEVKQRDKDYRRQQARSARKAKQVWRRFSNHRVATDTEDLEAIEDQLSVF